MKFFTTATAVVALSQASSAAVLKRQITGTTVQDSVTLWATDVTSVNNFLNGVFDGTLSAANPTELLNAAKLAQTFAVDEPMQLMRLGSLPGLSQQGINAAMNLMDVFGPGVLDNLQKIIDNPGDANTVNTAVSAINVVRCFNVLPDLCNLWPAAFTAVGSDPAQAGKPLFEKACTGVYQNAGVAAVCQGAAPVIQQTT